MTDIEKMAREAGLSCQPWDRRQSSAEILEGLARYTKAVARRCAEICEQTTEHGAQDLNGETRGYASAAAIREEFGLEEKP